MEVAMTTDWITVVDSEDEANSSGVYNQTNQFLGLTAEEQQQQKLGLSTRTSRAALLSEVTIIRMEIAHNHMSGQNSRLAQVHITAAVPSPSEHSLLTRMDERMSDLAWTSARIILDSVLSKLARRQQHVVGHFRRGGRLPDSFVVCSRPLLKEYARLVLRGKKSGGVGEFGAEPLRLKNVCRGLLPLILYANTDVVERFFEDGDAFVHLILLSTTGPVTSRTLALRLLRKLLPTRSPQHWDQLRRRDAFALICGNWMSSSCAALFLLVFQFTFGSLYSDKDLVFRKGTCFS